MRDTQLQTFRYIHTVITAGLFVMVLAGCNALAPTPTATLPPPAPTATSVPTQAPTPTALPTQTPLPTATPAPTATAVPPLAVLPNGFSVWCVPAQQAASSPVSSGKLAAPQGANLGKVINGKMSVIVPASSCTLSYVFTQKVPEDAAVQVYDEQSSKPWLAARLSAAPDNPKVGYVTLNHTYIQNPPTWSVTYRIELSSGDANVLRVDPVVFYKALPGRCWDNSLPDPVTLYCPSIDGDWNIEKNPPENVRGE